VERTSSCHEKTSAIAHQAFDHNMTLREAALKTRFLTVDEFDRIVSRNGWKSTARRGLCFICHGRGQVGGLVTLAITPDSKSFNRWSMRRVVEARLVIVSATPEPFAESTSNCPGRASR